MRETPATEMHPSAGTDKPPIISVIVPVYNVAAWVEQCLDSIAGQTFTDFECIIIDDGSTDESPAIVDRFASRDQRFTVIHQENRGLSGARNAGMEMARGEYFAFVDSDDFIHPEMLEKLLGAIEEQGTRIAMCDFEYVFEGGSAPSNYLREMPCDLLDERHFWLLCCDYATISAVAAWGKLWKRDIFDRARFEDGKISEDIIILSDVIPGNCPIALVKERLYRYRKRRGSITSGGTSIADRLYIISVRLNWDPYFAAQGWADVRVESLRYVVSNLAAICERIGMKLPEDRVFYGELRKRAVALYWKLLPHLLARPGIAAKITAYVIGERFHKLLFDMRDHLMPHKVEWQ